MSWLARRAVGLSGIPVHDLLFFFQVGSPQSNFSKMGKQKKNESFFDKTCNNDYKILDNPFQVGSWCPIKIHKCSKKEIYD